jgi:acetate kinase
MTDFLLTCNAGSSSFKGVLFDRDKLKVDQRFTVDYDEKPALNIIDSNGKAQESIKLKKPDSDSTIEALVKWLEDNGKMQNIAAVGHRIVHGGDIFTGPVWIDDKNMKEMRALTPLAPLHQPHNLAPIDKFKQAKPDLRQIACFDTSFHCDESWVARAYAVPPVLSQNHIKRYGFHGLSYEYIASCLSDVLPPDSQSRVIVAHLGSGCSAAALHNGKSVATTMGMTALDGLMMRTRCGTIDPGAVIYLLREKYSIDELEHILYEESGLKGIAGGTGDMRDLLAVENENKPAKQALELFCFMAARELGGLIAILGGVEAFIFTGAIGANSEEIRTRIMDYFKWLNRVSVLALPTNEALAMARHMQEMLSQEKGKNHVKAQTAA